MATIREMLDKPEAHPGMYKAVFGVDINAGGPGSGRHPSGIAKDTIKKMGRRYPNGSFIKPVSDSRLHNTFVKNLKQAGHTVVESGKYPNGTHYAHVKSSSGGTHEWNTHGGKISRQ
jgi:hypothetical protein